MKPLSPAQPFRKQSTEIANLAEKWRDNSPALRPEARPTRSPLIARCLFAFLSFLVLPTVNAAVITNLVLSSNGTSATTSRFLRVEAGQTAALINQAGNINTCRFREVIENVGIVHYPNGSSFPSTLTFRGPSTVEFILDTGNPVEAGAFNALVTFSIDGPAAGLVAVTNIPSNAVVIPADSAGPVRILLESSSDLVTWNSAEPGTYGTSHTNRFFRVRAVRN